MTATVASPASGEVAYEEPKSGFGWRALRILGAAWKVGVAVLLCLTPITALLVLGWLARLMQRQSLRTWFKASQLARAGMRFEGFVAADPEVRRFAAWPNWVLRQGGRQHLVETWAKRRGPMGKMGLLISAGLGSLWQNLKRGIETLITLWLYTLPVGALWMFAWWGGWENSFNKGYEQVWVGPTVALLGVAAFLVVMLYLPWALARQSATGSFRAAFDLKILRRLVKASPLRGTKLAALYCAAALPLFGIKAIPVFIEQAYPGYTALDPAAAKAFADTYYFWATVYLVLALVLVRRAVAAAYARTVVAALRRGTLVPDDLAPIERRFLDRVGLLDLPKTPLRKPLAKAVGWAGGRLKSLVARVATIALWFAFTAMIFVGQFLNHSWAYWLNHPLVQIPWIRS